METSYKQCLTQYFTQTYIGDMPAAGVGAPPPDALDAAPGADLPQRLHLVHGDCHPRAVPHHRPSQVVGRLLRCLLATSSSLTITFLGHGFIELFI